MKSKKIGAGLLAFLMAATTAAASAQTAFAADLGTVTDNVPAITAASASVSVLTASGDLEAAYAEWGAVSGATGYNVYIKSAGGSYTQLDTMLVRQYPDRFRADAVGLKAGSYTMKIVPVIGGKEDASKAAETSELNVEAHDRSGFGFVNGTSSGAYNEDGTLKADAIVVYVTDANKDTVTASIDSTGKGAADVTGVQNIITAYKKNKEKRPLCLRFIGNITDPADMPKGDLMIDTAKAGITIEGIGTDTVFNGFGLVMKNCSNVEVRNISFMNCDSSEGDDCGLQQGNDHIWVHNCDFFYGHAGSDADQVKGDGALDTKTSTYVTHSYNHFWDNGKCNLQGMKSEKETNYVTYHHNWYDHSDSRHPRIRTCSVHSYNNYFDGNAKYGIGVTMGASAFAENNYFCNCKNPMMSSGQGTDALGEGTFSGETGGIIKACGNYIEGASSYIPYSQDSTSFDAYEVSSPTEKVPDSVKTVSGGTGYNNFDTDSSIMYSYQADDAKDVPAIVTAKAGRVQGGDFQWKFDNSVDDASYAVNQPLQDALMNYTPTVVAIGSGFTDTTTDPVVTTETTKQTTVTTTTTTVSVSQDTSATATTVTTRDTTPTTPDVPVEGDIFCSPDGKGSGTSEKDPASVTDAISKLTPGHTIYLLGGTYNFSEMILIDDKNNGTADAMKTIKPYNGADVTFDFSGQGDADASKRGIVLDGDYWYFYGFEITKAADNGMLLSGSNNRLERMVFNDNQDTGLQLSRYKTSAATIADWPSNNLILNCTSKNNCDNATMENADGFAAKLTCGEGNVFDGCMSYNNSDDGWDLFAKSETGPIGVVTIQNCVAFRNGYTEFGEGYGKCDGNGFKLGGSGVGSAHVVKNCLAFENLNCGFTDNNNPKLDSLTNCTAYNNGVGSNGKPNVSCYRCTDDGADFSNLISYYSKENLTGNLGVSGLKITNDKMVGTIQNTIYYNSGYYQVGAKTAISNGDKLGTKGAAISDDDFILVTAPEMGTDFDTAWRNSNGSINTHGFMQVKENSSLYSILGAAFQDIDTPQPPITTTTTSATTATTETATKTETNPAQSSETASATETKPAESSVTASATETKPAESSETATATETKPAESSATATATETKPGESTTESATESKPTETQTTASEIATELLYGDVNLDGRVDITDAVLINKAIAGAVELSANQRHNSDVYADGELTTSDATTLLQFLVSMIKILPVTE